MRRNIFAAVKRNYCRKNIYKLIANGTNVQNGTGVKAEILTDGTENTVKMTLLEDLKDKNYVIGGYYTHNQISGLSLGKKYTFAIQAKGTGEWAMGHERVSIKVEKLSEEYNTYHSTSTASNSQYAAVILYANSGKAGKWIQYKMPTLQEGEATLPELTRTGYKFLGWYTERTGGRKIDPYEFVTGDTTYYAHWEAIPYKITTVLFGGTASGMPKTYTIEDDFTLPSASLNGYRFLGWTMTCKIGLTNVNGSIAKIDTFSPVESLHIQRGTIGDIVLTANYTKISSVSGNDKEHNKTPDDDGEKNHITDTGERKNPIITEGGTKHNKFTVTQK